MKRVWCLYRVSTKGQVNADEDIPMQRNACFDFAKKQKDWTITNELYERGVSGWSKKADERDELMSIREAAVNREFDVLLVFMFDRLGRRDDETPFVINFLIENEVEVWSVNEGQRKMEQHVDKLINYISSWQSSGESLKTSLRVRESKHQLSEQGYFQGGAAPYGYKIIETEQTHWKDKDRRIKELIPDEYESKIVKLIYNLYIERNYGYRKIIDHLNENGYRNREGGYFIISSVSRILDNPIFIGRKRYKSFKGKKGDTQPYNAKLRIIPDEMYYKVQEMKQTRKESLHDQDKVGIPLSGRLMFSGMAYCQYCGSKLAGNYLYRNYTKEDGSIYTTPIYRYRCPLNKGSIEHEKNIWGAKKIDKAIIQNVKDILSPINIEQFIDLSVNKKKETFDTKVKALNNLEKEQSQYTKQLDKLNMEIANSLIGKSAFTPEQLSGAIKGIETQLKELNSKIDILKQEISHEEDNYFDVKYTADELKNWETKFDQADDDLKKAMLSRIIDKVIFGKGEIDIQFNFMIDEILKLTYETV
ncbi:recombinase family protein [Neobacillus drentensis]|uniref:recombinase family protein n=1 Tax=Neobacillus drentensis TaxID=220684 RepID=UPI002FFEDBB2